MATKKKHKRKANADRPAISHYVMTAEQIRDEDFPGRGEGASERETPPPGRGVG